MIDNTRPLSRPLELTGLHEVLALFDTVDDAVGPHPDNHYPKQCLTQLMGMV